MKPHHRRRLAKKRKHLRERQEETTSKQTAPDFNPEASGEGAMTAEAGKEKSTTKSNEAVATLKLHSDTETANRSKLTFGELMQARVGHSWVSLDYHDKNNIPEDIHPRTQALLANDLGSFGFWPLINRTGLNEFTERGQQFHDMGLTPQSGESDNTEHRGFSKNPFKWVPGRVEEPDLSHQPTGTKEYTLTQNEVYSMLNYVEGKRGSDYNLYKYNCTTFAVEAVEAAGKSAPGGDFLGVCLPNALYKDMLEMSKDGDESVSLAPLREGEIHEKPRKRDRKSGK